MCFLGEFKIDHSWENPFNLINTLSKWSDFFIGHLEKPTYKQVQLIAGEFIEQDRFPGSASGT
jgi:hypothetical protein